MSRRSIGNAEPLCRNFRITRGSRTIQGVYRRCVSYVRYLASISHQQMGHLPEYRLSPRRPFLISGVYFSGPFQIRMSKGHGYKSTKGNIAIFKCMAVKVVHIEPVSDLSSDAFLAAYSRFAARRGA